MSANNNIFIVQVTPVNDITQQQQQQSQSGKFYLSHQVATDRLLKTAESLLFYKKVHHRAEFRPDSCLI
jgi:ABC-type transport system involved in cytochrome c biogenesis ATPase subunit